MDNEFKYLFWTELHNLLTKVSRWVANKQAQAARAYLPQAQQVWYEQALTSGILQDITLVARELGEEAKTPSLRALQYTWRLNEVTVYVDDEADYLTVHVGEQLVCSTQPQRRLFIPGHWLHVLAPYMERSQAHQQAWASVESQWDYSTC